MDPAPKTYEQLLAENKELREQNKVLTVQAGYASKEKDRLMHVNRTLSEKSMHLQGLNLKLQMELHKQTEAVGKLTKAVNGDPSAAMQLDHLNEIEQLSIQVKELSDVKALWEQEKMIAKENENRMNDIMKKFALSETHVRHLQDMCMDFTRGYYDESKKLQEEKKRLQEEKAALLVRLAALENANASDLLVLDGLDQLDQA